MLANYRLDTSNWMAAKSVLLAHSKSNPSESLAKSVAFVVKESKRNTPVVDPDTIVSDLSVSVTPRIGARGKPLSTRSAKNRLYNANGAPSGAGAFPNIPLSWLLISARAKAGSTYNESTDSRWAILGGHPFKGQPRSAFKSIMQDFLTRMVKARRSSTNFLQISWNGILDALVDYVPAGYKTAVSNWSAYNKKSKPIFGIGDARMAGQSTSNCQLTITNNMGLSDLYPNLDAKRNQAAHSILGPILQASIDRNFLQQVQIAQKNGYEEIAPLLAKCGMLVN